jgi:hypothetical protein
MNYFSENRKNLIWDGKNGREEPKSGAPAP